MFYFISHAHKPFRPMTKGQREHNTTPVNFQLSTVHKNTRTSQHAKPPHTLRILLYAALSTRPQRAYGKATCTSPPHLPSSIALNSFNSCKTSLAFGAKGGGSLPFSDPEPGELGLDKTRFIASSMREPFLLASVLGPITLLPVESL